MQVAAADLSLQSQYSYSRSLQQSVSFHLSASNSPTVTISDAGRSALAEDQASQASALGDAIDSTNADPFVQLVKRMVEQLTGEKIKVLSLQDLAASFSQTASIDVQAAGQAQSGNGGTNLAYEVHQSLSETEQASLSAKGVVRTADGKVISFELNLSMSRSFTQQADVSVQSRTAAKDPLVLNFDGNAAQLTDQRVLFDLFGDGQAQQIPGLGAHSAFLVFDRNGDGKANSGKELFGPASGNGFADLAKLDDDHNGWIDEGDAGYGKLALWNPARSERLTGLKESGVGAISTASAATPFQIRNDHGTTQGRIRGSGVYLGDDGHAGSVQQIDLNL